MNNHGAGRKARAFRISFCTTCMDRLHHLKKTLTMNIQDNSEYENLEFVVLNYNSKDLLDDWMRDEMIEYIKSRRIIYIKTSEPSFFRMAHAKNMVTKFASGDIVCNIDADNFTGPSFASYVNEQFNNDQNIFLASGQDVAPDLTGRICLWKSDFLKIRGYDEGILDYGYEDTDVYSRLARQMRRIMVKIAESRHLQSISHGNDERMMNGKYYDEIDFALTFEANGVIKTYVFNMNHRFEHLTIVPSDSNEGLSIDMTKHRHGEWIYKNGVIECTDTSSGGKTVLRTTDGGQTYSATAELYRPMPKVDACFYYSLLNGQMTFQKNIEDDRRVNPDGFGKGEVYEVFKDPIWQRKVNVIQ